MLKSVWLWILTNVFKISTETKVREIEDNKKYSFDYQRIDDINFNAIFSNKLSNYVASDSNLNITGENARVDLLSMIGKSMWKKIKKITSMAFGYGGIFLVPYVKKGKIFYSVVPQDRVTIDSIEGDLITGATILAERKEITSGLGQTKIYLRWTNYRLEESNIIIEQKFTDETGTSIPTPSFWQNILIKQTISNVDRVLFGYIKSPINNRRANDKYGVPITYGCDATIKEIKDTMKQLVREFENKQVFIGADATLFSGNNRLLDGNGLYKKLDSSENDFWEIFDPAFRETSYHARLEELYVRLEHEVGTSSGILSKVETQNATATEIKRSMYDTFTIVDDMRSNIEKGLEDFFYACNVLANTYNLSVIGEYELEFDWSYSLLEDTQQEFSQLIQGINLGVTKKVELRQWLNPDETLEESEKALKEIQQDNPSIEDLVGRDEGNNNFVENTKKEKEEKNKKQNQK